MRSQFVLDEKTERLLNDLAVTRAGNRSFIVREAIRLYANLEKWLDTVENQAGLHRMMKNSVADIKAGCVLNPRQLRQRRKQTNKTKGHSS